MYCNISFLVLGRLTLKNSKFSTSADLVFLVLSGSFQYYTKSATTYLYVLEGLYTFLYWDLNFHLTPLFYVVIIIISYKTLPKS